MLRGYGGDDDDAAACYFGYIIVVIIVAIAIIVKLEELHIATARKPLFHQTQPIACCQHRNQPCML